MSSQITWSILLLFTSIMSFANTAIESIENPVTKGLAIAKEMKSRDIGWGDMSASLKMILNSTGRKSIRQCRLKILEIEGGGDKSLTIFDYPSSVKGTVFLSFSNPIGADEQWMYLPALKRVKRIAGRSKSGPFMGSEFSYEDLSSFKVEKYTYSYLRDEPCDGGICYVIEKRPVDKHISYTKKLNWIDTREFRSWKIEFYGRGNHLVKTLAVAGYEQYLGKYWRPTAMNMTNHQTKKSTDIEWGDYQFRTGLTAANFDKNALKDISVKE